MSYFDGIFVVNDVYQLRLAEVWPVYGYGDPIITPIDSLYYLTKFVATSTSVSYPFNSDISTNKLNLNIVGDTKASNFNPYEPGYYSAYFDGSGDYLSVTIPGGLGAGDWTIEGWVNFATTPSNNGVFHIASAILPSTSSASIAMAGYNAPQWNLYNGAATGTADTGPVIQKNRWYHFARTRYNGSLITYVDGNQIHTAATDSSDHSSYNSVAIGGYYSTGYLMDGYISNFRIIRGASVYRGNFTPPSAPLTANVVSSIYASTANVFTSVPGANTFLLACNSNRFIDNSANAYTITRNGDVKIVAADPFTPNVLYQNYGSTYFDGTSDFVTIPYQNAPSILTGDFTIEMWVYPLAVNAFQPIFGQWLQTTGNGGFLLSLNSSGQFAFSFGAQSEAADFLTSSATSIANSWHHVAVVRSGSAFTLYVNGVSTATGTSSATRAALSVNYSFGNYYNGSGVLSASATHFGGYLSDVRMCSAAIYTGRFTPPSTPVLPIASSLPYTSTANVNTTFATTNVLMLTMQNNQPHNNTTFLDKSNYKQLITRNGNANQGTVSPYSGSWSNYFDGNGDYLNIANCGNFFAAASEDFTLEAWVYLNATGAGQMLCGWNKSGFDYVFFAADNTVGLNMNNTYNAYWTPSPVLSPNKWYHIAFSRISNNVSFYVNGVLQGAAISNSNSMGATGVALNIGNWYTSPNYYLNGFISNLRFIKGIGLYTGNFTPSTIPLLPTANTEILTCATNRFIDISPKNLIMTKNGDVKISTESPFSPAYTQPTPVSYSVSFDGAATIYLPSSTSLLGAGDYTVEFWVNITTAPTGGAYHTCFAYGSSGSVLRCFVFDSSGTKFGIWVGSGNVLQYATTAMIRQWAHIAIVRSGSACAAYINGVSVGTFTDSTNFNTGQLYIASQAASSYLPGYISNFRVVVGTSLYTTAFTPSTTPLSLVANTSLLTCNSVTIVDNSTNNFAITVTGQAKPLMGNPFGFNDPTLIDYTPNTFGGSVYFDSVSDWLTLPSSTMYDLVGDFTVEAWVYPTKQNGGTWTIIDARASGATAAAWIFNLGVTAGPVYKVNFFTGTDYTGSTVIPLNTWTHVAFERNGSVLTGYVNGARDYYNASYGTGAINPGATAPRIGSKDQGINSDYELMGYMSDIRFTNGAALYKGPFVPSQRPLQVYGNTTVMLNFTDAAIKDYTMRTNMETTGDLKVSTVNSKFSGSSMFFDGTGDYGNVTLVSNALILGTSDFTAEMWINPYSTSGTYYPMTIGSEATARFNIILVNGTLVVNLYGAASANLTLSGPVILPNTWTHIAVVRANANIRGYYNGNVLPNTYVTSAAIGNGPLRLGSDATGGAPFFGYMDDVRITANARYTANFTPAIAVLPTR